MVKCVEISSNIRVVDKSWHPSCYSYEIEKQTKKHFIRLGLNFP